MIFVPLYMNIKIPPTHMVVDKLGETKNKFVWQKYKKYLRFHQIFRSRSIIFMIFIKNRSVVQNLGECMS